MVLGSLINVGAVQTRHALGHVITVTGAITFRMTAQFNHVIISQNVMVVHSNIQHCNRANYCFGYEVLLELYTNGTVIFPENSRKHHVCVSACNCFASAEPQTVALCTHKKKKKKKTGGAYRVCLVYKSAVMYR